MPIIDLTIPSGSIENLDQLLDDLATTLLRWEGAPDTEFFRQNTWVYVREASAVVGGRPGGAPRFRVDITVPAGALSERRKKGLVADVHELMSKAAGLTAEQAMQVWTLIREVPDGNWGVAGQVIDFGMLKQVSQQQREAAAAAV